MRLAPALRSLARFAAVPRRSLAQHQGLHIRCLHSSTPFFSSAASQLVECLEGEIRAEKELESQSLSQASFPGFNVATNGAEVRLTKKHGNEDILVIFNVNHSVDVNEDAEGEAPDAAPVPVALPPFQVEITKGPERLCFHLEVCEGANQQYDFAVEEFYIANAAKGNEEDVASHVYASSGQYIDSNLHDLLFVRYLEERGLDTHFCNTLVQYATHYEHSQYVGLLNKIKEFVTK